MSVNFKVCSLFIVCVFFLSACSKVQTPYSMPHKLIGSKFNDRVDGEEVETTTTTYLKRKGHEFVDSYWALKTAESTGDPVPTKALADFVSKTMTYTNLLCTDFFSRLSYTQSHRNFAQTETNLVGGFVSTVLGLTEGNPKVVGGVAGLFSLGEASFDSYEAAYLASSDIRLLEELVRQKMRSNEVEIYTKLNQADGVTWPIAIRTMSEAERALDDYIYSCTANGIKHLLHVSLQEKATKLEGEIDTDKKALADLQAGGGTQSNSTVEAEIETD